MQPITPTAILLCLFFFLFIATLVKAVILKKQKDLFFYKLAEANGFFDEVREELRILQDKHKKTDNFKNTLSQAELTTHLQQTRISAQSISPAKPIPEKYSFIHSLLKKQMSSEEIASILSISLCEAEQLVTLSTLGRTH